MNDSLPAMSEESQAPLTVGNAAAAAREQHEIQSAIISAKRFPRNETDANTAIMRACQREGLADDALYSFPRGGKSVEGPSVYLAREMARMWGNLRAGLRVVEGDDDYVHIKGYCFDAQTNFYVEMEDKVRALIQRKDKRDGTTKWVKPDERDLRELVNKRGAVLIRNAILQVIPADITAAAQKVCKDTLKKKAANELKESREDVVRRMGFAFDGVGVSAEMLERKLGHKLSLITDAEVVELTTIHKSIKDGHSKRGEHFEFETKADELTKSLKKESKE